jgi:hypothetical protein
MRLKERQSLPDACTERRGSRIAQAKVKRRARDELSFAEMRSIGVTYEIKYEMFYKAWF